jgi:hypothetical protein
MSPRLSSIAAALVCGAAVLHAADPAPAKPAADPAPEKSADPVEPYVLKKRSEFAAADASARAPFWPIGWVKRKPGVKQEVAAAPAPPPVALDEKSFRVTSILLGTGTTPSLAVINGRAYSEGEFLRMPKGSATPPLRIRVQRINDGTVILQNANQTMVASLVRSELQNKRSEELLLDPDR